MKRAGSLLIGIVLLAAALLPLDVSAASCPNLSRYLSYGSCGSDVTQLQQFLIS